ncbi:macrolide ABC transporter ATP-binding protein, partial [Candidatus Falkowbacteria bacterium RIFOXYB2_FULL_35_7]
FVAIMGPSGSGKSTLMHILGFLDKLSSGKYFFKGKDTSNLTEDQMAGYRNFEIGFVFQAFNLLPRTSVFDNVKLPLTYANKIENIDEKVNKAIQAVGLWHRKDNLSNQLSGGEKQRVAIARALVNDPSLIFADEPTGNLDSKTGGQVMKILQDLNKQGKTIILVTHEQYTAEHAKRIFKIRDGLIEADFTVEKHREIKDGDELIK